MNNILQKNILIRLSIFIVWILIVFNTNFYHIIYQILITTVLLIVLLIEICSIIFHKYTSKSIFLIINFICSLIISYFILNLFNKFIGPNSWDAFKWIFELLFIIISVPILFGIIIWINSVITINSVIFKTFWVLVFIIEIILIFLIIFNKVNTNLECKDIYCYDPISLANDALLKKHDIRICDNFKISKLDYYIKEHRGSYSIRNNVFDWKIECYKEVMTMFWNEQTTSKARLELCMKIPDDIFEWLKKEEPLISYAKDPINFIENFSKVCVLKRK